MLTLDASSLDMGSRRISVSSVRAIEAEYILTVADSFQDLYVPPEQVIDTVDLYFIRSRQRRLSLRFLSWFVLNQNIQMDTHDSIEDARSALMLYKAYQDFEGRGEFDEKLDELYREGKQHVRIAQSFLRTYTDGQIQLQNWKPPSAKDASSPAPSTVAQASAMPLGMLSGNMTQTTYNQSVYPTSHTTTPLPNAFVPGANPFAQYQQQWAPRGHR